MIITGTYKTRDSIIPSRASSDINKWLYWINSTRIANMHTEIYRRIEFIGMRFLSVVDLQGHCF